MQKKASQIACNSAKFIIESFLYIINIINPAKTAASPDFMSTTIITAAEINASIRSIIPAHFLSDILEKVAASPLFLAHLKAVTLYPLNERENIYETAITKTALNS